MSKKHNKNKNIRNEATEVVGFSDEKSMKEAGDKVILEQVKIKKQLKLKSNYALNFSGLRFFDENIEKPQEVIAKEEIENANKEVAKRRSKKKKIMSLVFFLVNIAVIAGILVYQISTDIEGVTSFDFSKVNWWYIVAVFGLFLVIMTSEQLRFMNLIKKATGIPRPHVSYKVAAIGKYYDMITPFAVGGQPFQIFYLNKYGVSGGASTSITMGKYIFSQIVYFILISIIMFGVIGTTINGTSPEQIAVRTASWIGYGVIVLLMATVSIISLSRKLGAGLVIACLKLFCKIFRQNYNKLFKRVMRTVMTWQHTMRRYSKSPWVWFVNILGSTVGLIASWLIPYFIYCAFVGWSPDAIIPMVALIVLTELASSVMPLPGGTGMAELSFMALFASMFASAGMPGALFWALIIWRIMAYYIYILQGLGLLCYDFIIGNKRIEKHKEKWMKPRFKFVRKIKDE
ncbi:MAG: flippase-like domain-containing protein [Christensenellaceae bacterium]|jgi:uncharacterized protein (TIRG00374 family)|nr:flippase-like domain-containing protein [Christensenellaceae bacterium]